MKRLFVLLLLIACFSSLSVRGQEPQTVCSDIHPLDLSFQRLAVRRFIFSNNIMLNEFVPSEIVAFESMHPTFTISSTDEPKLHPSFRSIIDKGQLLLNEDAGRQPASIYMGGVNPYATYEVDIEACRIGKHPVETGIELARLGLRDRIQVIVRQTKKDCEFFLRIYDNNELKRETKYPTVLPSGALSLKVQLYGRTLGIFATQNNRTTYIGHVLPNEHFGHVLDFRSIKTAANCTFNLITNLAGEVRIKGARSFLSPGIGQADIRLISNEDLSPYLDNGRLWFTFTCRGIDTSQGVQGVLSLDPSVFDIRFEGMIVFDHGDGLLRNDYASHLFFDRNVKKWCAYVCDFGGSFNKEGRTQPGLIIASSPKDPRRGYSVMRASLVDSSFIDGHNEDPCIFFDAKVNKWRLLTSAFVNGTITSRTFEADTWNGSFSVIAPPIATNSTGTSIQRIGSQYYAFMGGEGGNLRIHSYPDLEEIGELKLNLQPHWPKPAGRIWASVVPLPEGFPYRYVLLTMDRPNFPGIKVHNWSYGALYFYGANLENVSSEEYEF